jgi:hydroxypyruvate reductase
MAAFDAAVDAARADVLIPYLKALPEVQGQRRFLLVGKAAASQAEVLESVIEQPIGLCIVPKGHRVQTTLSVIEASHPTPDHGSFEAAKAALALAESIEVDDQLVCLISGGGSSLMAAPLPGMDSTLKLDVHRALLASGASISELNTVRKQLSLVKGGRLAQACRGSLVNLLVSDVPQDCVEMIASGPTVPAHTSQSDALAVLERYDIDLKTALRPWLTDPAYATPASTDACFQRVTTQIVAAPSQSLERAADVLTSAGVDCWILGDSIEGPSEIVARVMAETALWQQRKGALARPLCLLSGGETTVRVTGDGIGGPNAHFALTLVDALQGASGIAALVCDTDGVDGGAPIAGAYVDEHTARLARQRGLNHRDALARQDAHTFFSALGQSIVSGPTGTNVNDFRAIMITP